MCIRMNVCIYIYICSYIKAIKYMLPMKIPSCTRFKKLFMLILSLSRAVGKKSSACRI